MNRSPASAEFTRENGNEDLWHQVFQVGHPILAGKQRRYGLLPGKERCKLCYAPMAGLGGWVTRRMGLKPSARNPLFCNACDGFLAAFPGGAEVDVSILFCDLRQSVSLSDTMSPREFQELIAVMRTTVMPVLWENDGFVLQFQGDSVIGVWLPGFSGKDFAKKSLEGARRLSEALARTRFKGASLPVGVSLHTGRAYICTVASVDGDLQGISAFGFDVNVAARLADVAEAGEILVSEAAHSAAGGAAGEDALQSYQFKGISENVRATSIR